MIEPKQAARHVTKYNFDDTVFHNVTGDKGKIQGIKLRPRSQPIYMVIFEDEGLREVECYETELQDEPLTKIPT